MNSNASAAKANWFKYAAAACAVLLAGSLYWNVSQYNRNKKLQTSYDEVARDYDSMAVRMAGVEDEIAMMTLNPNIKMAAMKVLLPGFFSYRVLGQHI
jgi:hypothetical protein